MKQLLSIYLLLVACAAGRANNYHTIINDYALDIDSIGIEACPDTVCVDTLDFTETLIPQIPLGQCDDFTLSSLDARYGVVRKDGKFGIYDIANEMNVTRIVYTDLKYSTREEMEGEYYTYFTYSDGITMGRIVVAESNNNFVEVSIAD